MKTETTVTAVDEGSNVRILVDSIHADSLFKHLKSKMVNCEPPTDEVFGRSGLYIDENGRKQIDPEVYYKEIVAVGTSKDFFEKWIDGWSISAMEY